MNGRLYVAFSIDVLAHRIVGWRASSSMTTEFVLDTLEQALSAPPPGDDGSSIRVNGSNCVMQRNRSHETKLLYTSLIVI